MKRTINSLAIVLVVAWLRNQAIAATATVVGDAYTSSSSSTSNFAAKKSLIIKGPPASSTVATVYVQFDLSSLPPGITGNEVAKATLSVGVNKVSAPGSFDVFRTTSAWTEAGITSATAPTLGGSPEVSGVALATSDKNTFKTIDLTQLVKDWLDNVLPNDGIALVPTLAGIAAQFDSKESTATSHPAQLDIELSPGSTFTGSLSGDVTGTQAVTQVAKINGSPLGALGSASSGQALTFNGSNWSPSSMVNSVSAGSGISTSSSTGNVTLSVPAGGVTNSMLANSSVTVTAGSGLSGGGAVALGGTTTLNNAGVLSVSASAPLVSSGGQNPSVALTGTVPIVNGGTGAGTATSARSNLGAAASGANSDITSLAGITGNIDLPNSTAPAGNIVKGGDRFMHNFGTSNTFIGQNSGNFSLTGGSNTALGVDALKANTTGFSNSAVGVVALAANTTGGRNTAVGQFALQSNSTGSDNTGVGLSALDANTTASANTAVGEGASQLNTAGSNNCAFGQSALILNTASNNTGLGRGALSNNTTGTNNVAIGQGAGGALTTGDNNISIASIGVAAEANTIRIGTAGTQNATFIAGISGATSAAGIAVFVNASGQLGTTTSSARFKDDIRDMGESTSALMKLRPVRFHYKEEIDPSGLEQYGLVAEEVAKVYPNLVVYDANGEPQTVRYHFINAMLLNEVQKQAQQIEALTARLVQLEGVVSARVGAPAVKAGYNMQPGL